MTSSKSMPLSAVSASADTQTSIQEKSELIDRLATEMRAKSGGELPLSFCIHQIRIKLSGELRDSVTSTERPAPTPPAGSVFHAWAIRE